MTDNPAISKVLRTASPVLDISSNGQSRSIYRCDTCKALVLKDDAFDHLSWHGTIMHYVPGISDSLKED